LLPDDVSRPFVQDIVYTCIRRLRALRMVLGRFVKTWPKGELEALLYVGAAQILYMDSVPDFAAVNETVNAAKECENPSIPKVVNGVLRNMLRNREELEKLLAGAPAEVRHSFPGVIARRWRERFGEDEAGRMMALHNVPASTFLAHRSGEFTRLERGRRVEAVPGYAEGEFIVQNPATALAVEMVGAAAGDKVLDACAAPGGKAIQLAWRGAEVVACEVNPKRRRVLEQNIARVRLGGAIRTVASLDDASLRGVLFDKVLVDAPCSNTGVFRRKPDARWNWSEERLASLVRLQAEILDWCAKFVKPGGRLVYSTCSCEAEENQAQVQAFLARHGDFTLEREEESLPGDELDGAFAAALVKKGDAARQQTI